jgi:predicted DNA-binding antitoxin AbrB/MazE fold protein
MTQQVNAIYDHGVFKPLGPLDLNDQELVLLSVQKVNPEVGEVNNLEPTLFEVLDEVGLIGCVKDAPADLSSNPRHLEGFGKSGN